LPLHPIEAQSCLRRCETACQQAYPQEI
jgi:hypothetical protein